MKRVKDLPENFIYTSVVQDNGRINALGYDLDTNTKVHFITSNLPDLAYYVEDYSNSNSPYKTYISNKPLKRYECKTISEYKKAISSNNQVEGLNIHGDFNIISQWINQTCGPKIKANSDMYIPKAITNINIGYVDIEVMLGKTFPTPTLAEYPITAITIYCSKSKVFYVFTDKQLSSKGITELTNLVEQEKLSKFKLHKDSRVEVRTYENNEEQMIVDFAKVISEIEQIDILTGWNSSNFDVPYIYFRTKRLFGDYGPNMLSPLGKATEYFSVKKNKHILDIKGINLIDSMVWYQDFTRNIKILPSYSLEYVSNYELKCGKAKLPGTLRETYEKYYDQYIYYNLMDVIRLVQLMEAKKFFTVTFIIAYKYYSCLLKDVQSPVVGWESIVYQNTHPRNLIFEKRKFQPSGSGYPGAYVHVPSPGFYKDIVTGDVNSMYPHIHMGWFISPETHIKDDNFIISHFNNHPEVIRLLKLRNSAPNYLDNDTQATWWDENVILPLIRNEFDLSFLENETEICMAPSLEFFIKDEEAIMPKQFKTTYNDRKVLKAEENKLKSMAEKEKDEQKAEDILFQSGLKKIEQIALKIVLNAGYGAVGSPMFYFNENRISRTITLTGRYIIQSSAIEVSNKFKDFLKDQFNYEPKVTTWIYSDTDAVDLTFEELTNCINRNSDVPLTDNERADMLDAFWKEHVQCWLNDHFANVAKMFNSKDVIVMKREIIALSGIWRNLQKHYALLVIDDEGTRYSVPEVHMKGTQFVSTSIPEKCKEVYDEVINLLVRSMNPRSLSVRDKIIRMIDEFRGKFIELPIFEICQPIGTNKIEEYVDKNGNPIKGSPHNVKAANAYNQFLYRNNLVEQGYSPIQSGTKIRIFPLKKGNPYNNTTFGFIKELPKEFDCRYIDYEEMFHKNFLKYIEALLKELNIEWNLKEVGTPVPDDAF